MFFYKKLNNWLSLFMHLPFTSFYCLHIIYFLSFFIFLGLLWYKFQYIAGNWLMFSNILVKLIKQKLVGQVSWECDPLIISYQLSVSVSLKFGACYINGQWGEFRIKNATSCFQILFWRVFFVLFCFSS